jgi:hypothetical protein
MKNTKSAKAQMDHLSGKEEDSLSKSGNSLDSKKVFPNAGTKTHSLAHKVRVKQAGHGRRRNSPRSALSEIFEMVATYSLLREKDARKW